MAKYLSLLWQGLHWIGGGPLAVLILSAGIYLMVRYRFLPLRRFGTAFRLTIGNLFAPRRERQAAGDISPYQALTTALAATVGTGNIAGVATAITLGGPGALFWMWVSGFFGPWIKFSEIVLAYITGATYLTVISPGPMYVLERGLKQRWLGLTFAFCLPCGSDRQPGPANSAAAVAYSSWGIPPL